MRVAVVQTRWNEEIIAMLRDACLATLREQGVKKIDTLTIPGAYEFPLTCQALGQSGKYDAVIAIGCVIRGDTPHFDYVAGEAARGITDAALATGVPVIFGVLTVNTHEQAESRANPVKDNKGREFALAAIEMANLITTIKEA
nr:6,7-dimethyl-8-ribityllumazine synthase [Aquisalinus flavus]